MRTTIYQLNSRARGLGRRTRWFGLAVGFALLFWGGDTLVDWLRRPILEFANPFWAIQAAAADQLAGLAAATTRSRIKLAKDNQLLRLRVAQLESRLLSLESVARDNDALRRELGLDASKDVPPLVARIIALPWRSPYDVMTIDLGADNSQRAIGIGDWVIADRLYLLGQVVEVKGRYSRVKLFSAAGTELAVFLGSESVPATLVGRGGGNFKATVARSSEIKEGAAATVRLPSFDAIVALVGKSDVNLEDPLQSLLLGLPVNINRLKWVEIYDY